MGCNGIICATNRLCDCVLVCEQQVIKSMIHPPEWSGLGCIKKVADSGRVAGGGGAEVQGGQGVASGRVIQDVSKHEPENRYQRRAYQFGLSVRLFTLDAAGFIPGEAHLLPSNGSEYPRMPPGLSGREPHHCPLAKAPSRGRAEVTFPRGKPGGIFLMLFSSF